jgi:hypothetical protein
MTEISILSILLFLAGYTLVGVFTYVFARFFLDLFDYFWVALGAVFWPAGVWIIVGMGLAQTLGGMAEGLRDSLAYKKKMKQQKTRAEYLELQKIIEQLESEINQNTR